MSPPFISEKEAEYVQQAIDSNWIAPLGPFVNKFETGIQKFTKSKMSVACISGTAAIHTCLKAVNVSQGDLVACSTFTFAGSAFPIAYLNANPIFIDAEKETWNMDPVLLERCILDLHKNGKKLKAILVVHLFGMPAKMNEIMKLAHKYKVPVIEDAAESLGTFYYGKSTGVIGDLGVFSFNGNKLITCSNGGMIVSKNKKYEKRIRKMINQAIEPNFDFYQHKEIGHNYRLSNILAALGLAQLERIDDILKRKKSIYNLYKQKIKNFKSQKEQLGYDSNFWLTTTLFNSAKRRNRIFKTLKESNIDARLPWKPMHLQPVFKNAKSYTTGVSENIFKKGLCLPSGANLPHAQLRRICKILNEIN